MAASQAEAGPSFAPSLSLLPANVLTIFLARFHVRHGNQIEYQYPPPPKGSTADNAKLIDIDEGQAQVLHDANHSVDLTGVEWKVLPSGGHLVDKDVIYFQTSHKGSTGVACFRNIALSDNVADEDAARQRGARMVSVGLILQCEGHAEQHASSLAQQLAIVPHLSNLEKLADDLALDPKDTSSLQRYYEMHKAHTASTNSTTTPTMDGKRMKQLRMRRRRDPRNLPHDPISHMSALCGSLGALLPHLLKKLMLPRHRLLIFSPSPPIVHAAHLGYNLADLVALGIARSGKRHENLQAFARRWIVQIKGQIGVHDITALEDEERRRSQSPGLEPSWIAWSTDKILLDKPHLFDSVLDLTPLISRDSNGVLDEMCLESASTMARLWTVVRPSPSAGRANAKAQLKAQSWTTREFATFNELDAQAQRHAERAERLGAGACISRRKSRNKLVRSTTRRSEEQRNGDVEYTHEQTSAVSQWRGGCARSPRRSGAGTVSAALAFLRYWLAGWWFLPSHWRYGLPAAYVLPLGIRGDGGVRASILVMPEDESDSEVSDPDLEDDREIAAEDEEEEERRSALAIEPEMLTESMPVTEQTSTNSSSDTSGLDLPHAHRHHHLVPPDPLLAAVGASHLRGESDRMSHASLHRRRSTDRSLYARSSSGDHPLLDDDENETRFRSILSGSLWMVWSHWTSALVSGLLDVLEDRLAGLEQEDETEALITKFRAGLEVSLGAKDMASLGLSAGNALDVALVETLGGLVLNALTETLGEGEARVCVDKGWSVFRWLL
ncbi:Protein of unknown function DUF2347 [Kalmanozyma brasiliensis GHG001]|uniref:UDENN domain-containing protein n=1 Tax=Kalmanozyma brasiliensis (strain GHG001) TaxID=1365824 RepID=V5GIC4_KALBG|nr:Protein of unknown function DUF2347 [Kalmanozyma brasiliensis GHG001]EST05727.1 Protein of unknown function DUF2347 [Kalmanozyma brasiliensis GHG001]